MVYDSLNSGLVEESNGSVLVWLMLCFLSVVGMH